MSCLLVVCLLPGVPAAGNPEWTISELAPVRSFRSFDKTRTPSIPQSTVMALHQDEKGILWLATLDGVGTFDGTRIERVSGSGELPSYGPYFTFARRASGGLHVGSNSWVYTFDGVAWTRIPAPGSAQFLAEDKKGVLWRLDNRGRAWWATGTTVGQPWTPAPVPAGWTSAVALTAGPDGTLWLASGDAVYRQGDDLAWLKVGSRPPRGISALKPARDGSCWIGTETGEVYAHGPDQPEWAAADIPPWNGGRVRALEEDRRGRIWAGGLGGGVAFGRRGEAWSVWGPESGLNREGCLAILADREGTLWFSTNGHGLQQWIGEAWSHRNRWQGDPWSEHRLQIFGIDKTLDGGFLAAAFDRGLWRWTGEDMLQIGSESGLTENVRSAREVEPGRIWVATRFGVFESDPGGRFRRALELDSGFAFTFHQAPDGTWYTSTSASGLYRREANRWVPAEELNAHLPDLGVRAVLWRSPDELWVGTLGGIQVFVDGRPRPLEPNSKISVVHALLAADEGAIWIGGTGGIENRRDGVIQHWSVDDGLPGQTIYALARATDGAIWAGGSAGAGRYQDGRWQVFDMGSGLLEEECNHLALAPLDGGSMLVGTMASLAYFDASVEELPRPPLGVYWLDRPATAPDGIAYLPADQRSARLGWHAPWLAPDKVEYRIQIPRLDDRWSPPQANGSLTLENLDAGLWEVWVSARLADGGGWTEPVVTRLFVEPTFWETWIFRGLVVIMALLAVAGLVRWRTRQLARRAAALEAAVQENLAQIKVLGGLLPICSYCKKVRDDAGYWQQIESYIRRHSEADFSHGLCPTCFEDLYQDLADDSADIPQSTPAPISPGAGEEGSSTDP